MVKCPEPLQAIQRGPMSGLGQKRPKGDVRVESALLQTADIGRHGWQVYSMPKAVIPTNSIADRQHHQTGMIFVAS
jgi:hypothetical protein